MATRVRSKFYLVLTPRVAQVWKSGQEPKLNYSSVLASARYPDVGRRVKKLQPVELIKLHVECDGELLADAPLWRVSGYHLSRTLPDHTVEMNAVRYGIIGNGINSENVEPNKRFGCFPVTSAQATELIRGFPRNPEV